MTNEETLSALILMRDNCVNKREYDDPMREIKQRALEAAIKALENQERMQRELKSLDGIADTCDKLDRALHTAVRDSDKTGTDVWCHDCPYDDDVKLEHCRECGVKYYKRKAGIEADKNDE